MNAYDRAKELLAAISVMPGEATRDEITAALDAADQARREARQVSDAIEAIAKDWIAENGEVVIGETRYYVGPKKTIKPRSIALIFETLHKRGTADLLACLSSDPFKQGTVKKTVGQEVWDTLYEVKVDVNLEAGELTEKIKKANDAFN